MRGKKLHKVTMQGVTKIFKRRILGNRWRRKINISLIFFFLSVSFLFGEKTPADMYKYLHLHIHIYICRATYQPKYQIPLLAKKKKPQMPNVKKKALRTTETNPLHCITIIKSFA